MTSASDDDQDVHGRPQNEATPKKPVSGTRSRRSRRRSKNPVEIIDSQFLKPVRITINGKRKVVSTLEAIVTQLWAREISGDQRALRVRQKYQELSLQRPEPKLTLTFVDDEYARALATAPAPRDIDNE